MPVKKRGSAKTRKQPTKKDLEITPDIKIKSAKPFAKSTSFATEKLKHQKAAL